MSSYNAICLRVQKGIKAFLDTRVALLSWTNETGSVTPAVLRGVTSDRKTLPAVIVECNSADHESMGFWTGNWKARVEIHLRENADDTTEDQHLEHFGEIVDMFAIDTFVADMDTACSGTFNTELCNPGTVSYSIVERSWESVLTFELLCNTTTVT